MRNPDKREGINSVSCISKIKGIQVILAQMNINSGFFQNWLFGDLIQTLLVYSVASPHSKSPKRYKWGTKQTVIPVWWLPHCLNERFKNLVQLPIMAQLLQDQFEKRLQNSSSLSKCLSTYVFGGPSWYEFNNVIASIKFFIKIILLLNVSKFGPQVSRKFLCFRDRKIFRQYFH